MSAVMDPMQQQPQPMPPQAAPQQPMPPQQGQPPVDEDAQFETILAGLLEFIFGKGRKGIEKQLRGAKDVPKVIGDITFTLLQEAANQAKQAQQEVDIEMMLGVATEIIDSLIRMAAAMKIKVDVDLFREQAMMNAINDYMLTMQSNPEEQEIARQLLAEFQQDGTVDVAAQEISAIGQRAGVDPFAKAGMMGA